MRTYIIEGYVDPANVVDAKAVSCKHKPYSECFNRYKARHEVFNSTDAIARHMSGLRVKFHA